MIDHPFLSFKELSDEELLDKTADIHRKLNRAYLWGSSPDLINQLQWMLEMIEEEKMERLQKQNFDTFNAMFPEIVESDPEFKQEKSEVAETNTKVVKPAAKKALNLPIPKFDKEYTDKSKKDK